MDQTPSNPPTWLEEYTALTTRVGLVDFGDRTLIELAGEDRAKFLHGLCTGDVRKLSPGQGCEAFVTNVQGHSIGHVLVFCDADALYGHTVPGQAEPLLRHFDRYLIREKVTLRDCSGERGEWLLAGPQSETVLRAAGAEQLPAARLASAAARLTTKSLSENRLGEGDSPILLRGPRKIGTVPDGFRIGSETSTVELTLRRVDLAGPVGFLVECPSASASAVGDELVRRGAVRCGEPAFEAARIEAGWPLFGRVITQSNLPQEVARDSLAISFSKGCYLGQETVARIDALGHVNRVLGGVRFESPTPPAPGDALTIDGKPVGHVTSASFSPRLGAALALAYLRRGSHEPGTRLDSPVGLGVVVSVPVG